ncbi:eukaryotic translation initiation factor 2 subunit beta isoform X4 [Helianthus annuus]|uniref:eukaryotic translation initiation factor 2 subunit beta isoform X4 n=1 Tax=Helianthus annuus TaxID=4232 RepID=UPI000B902CF0|nr:eukaryotic translation initiation factor 2 subunit beta isoform X4 [Helianthus annuus]
MLSFYELGTSGSLDRQQRLVVKGRFAPKTLKGFSCDIGCKSLDKTPGYNSFKGELSFLPQTDIMRSFGAKFKDSEILAQKNV